MIINYKINQPFTSNLSVEEGEKKIPVALEIMEPPDLSTMLKPVLRRSQKSQWKENHTVATLWKPIVPGWTIFFLVPFKESRLPLFGISILEALDPKDLGRQGLTSFRKHKRPISSENLEVLYAANQLGLNAPESLQIRHGLTHSLLRKERPWKQTRDKTQWPSTQNSRCLTFADCRLQITDCIQLTIIKIVDYKRRWLRSGGRNSWRPQNLIRHKSLSYCNLDTLTT